MLSFGSFTPSSASTRRASQWVSSSLPMCSWDLSLYKLTFSSGFGFPSQLEGVVLVRETSKALSAMAPLRSWQWYFPKNDKDPIKVSSGMWFLLVYIFFTKTLEGGELLPPPQSPSLPHTQCIRVKRTDHQYAHNQKAGVKGWEQFLYGNIK